MVFCCIRFSYMCHAVADVLLVPISSNVLYLCLVQYSAVTLGIA